MNIYFVGMCIAMVLFLGISWIVSEKYRGLLCRGKKGSAYIDSRLYDCFLYKYGNVYGTCRGSIRRSIVFHDIICRYAVCGIYTWGSIFRKVFKTKRRNDNSGIFWHEVLFAITAIIMMPQVFFVSYSGCWNAYDCCHEC